MYDGCRVLPLESLGVSLVNLNGPGAGEACLVRCLGEQSATCEHATFQAILHPTHAMLQRLRGRDGDGALARDDLERGTHVAQGLAQLRVVDVDDGDTGSWSALSADSAVTRVVQAQGQGAVVVLGLDALTRGESSARESAPLEIDAGSVAVFAEGSCAAS